MKKALLHKRMNLAKSLFNSAFKRFDIYDYGYTVDVVFASNEQLYKLPISRSARSERDGFSDFWLIPEKILWEVNNEGKR